MKGKTILFAGAALAAVAMAASPAAAGEYWWANTSISGRMYFDWTNINEKSNSTSSPYNGTHFDIKRFYISIDHTFDDVWSADVTTDVGYDSGAGLSQVYIKKAYLQGKFDPAITIRLGSFDMPWIPFAEDVYGYRYVENTLVDRIKFGNSADWGGNMLGSFGGDDMKVEYSLAVVNGAGYKHPAMGLSTNRSRSMDFEGRVDVKADGFVVAVGGYSGKEGQDVKGIPTRTATRFDAIAGYVANGFHVGVEYFSDNNWDAVNEATHPFSDSGDGWSGFAAYQFTPEWAVFGRYDNVKPEKSVHYMPDYTNDYENIGIEWSPTKIVDLSLVYKHDEGSHGTFGDQNGTIGGSASGHYDEIGLFGQLRW